MKHGVFQFTNNSITQKSRNLRYNSSYVTNKILCFILIKKLKQELLTFSWMKKSHGKKEILLSKITKESGPITCNIFVSEVENRK